MPEYILLIRHTTLPGTRHSVCRTARKRAKGPQHCVCGPFALRIRELLFAASVVGHTFVVHGFGPVVIFIGEDINPAQTTVGEFFEDLFVLVTNRPRKIILGGEQIAFGYRMKEICVYGIIRHILVIDNRY
jgi:hypothetical protein